MGQKLPQANLNTGRYTDSQLIARAQQVHDGLAANTVTFPTLDLPVALVDLQTQIDDYKAASAAAIKGTKAQTATKHSTKQILILSLKALAIYVTQRSQAGGLGTPQDILDATNIIHLSGFDVSVNPTRPVDAISGIPAPIIRKAISDAAGTLKILVRQYTNANRNTLLYQVNYRTSATTNPVAPAGDWQTQTFTGQNEILLTGLTSGLSYDWQIASIGGRDAKRNENPPVNYTPIASAIII